MIGLQRSTVSPYNSSMRRSTPWVLGCCGPMLMIIVWSSSGSSGRSPRSAASASANAAQVIPAAAKEPVVVGAGPELGHHLAQVVVDGTVGEQTREKPRSGSYISHDHSRSQVTSQQDLLSSIVGFPPVTLKPSDKLPYIGCIEGIVDSWLDAFSLRTGDGWQPKR